MPATSASTKNKRSRPSGSSKSSSKSRAKSSKPASKNGAGSGSAAGITNYTTATKWLYDHIDHDRMRIVKYNESTFCLDRLRKLLKLLG